MSYDFIIYILSRFCDYMFKYFSNILEFSLNACKRLHVLLTFDTISFHLILTGKSWSFQMYITHTQLELVFSLRIRTKRSSWPQIKYEQMCNFSKNVVPCTVAIFLASVARGIIRYLVKGMVVQMIRRHLPSKYHDVCSLKKFEDTKSYA